MDYFSNQRPLWIHKNVASKMSSWTIPTENSNQICKVVLHKPFDILLSLVVVEVLLNKWTNGKWRTLWAACWNYTRISKSNKIILRPFFMHPLKTIVRIHHTKTNNKFMANTSLKSQHFLLYFFFLFRNIYFWFAFCNFVVWALARLIASARMIGMEFEHYGKQKHG